MAVRHAGGDGFKGNVVQPNSMRRYDFFSRKEKQFDLPYRRWRSGESDNLCGKYLGMHNQKTQSAYWSDLVRYFLEKIKSTLVCTMYIHNKYMSMRKIASTIQGTLKLHCQQRRRNS